MIYAILCAILNASHQREGASPHLSPDGQRLSISHQRGCLSISHQRAGASPSLTRGGAYLQISHQRAGASPSLTRGGVSPSLTRGRAPLHLSPEGAPISRSLTRGRAPLHLSPEGGRLDVLRVLPPTTDGCLSLCLMRSPRTRLGHVASLCGGGDAMSPCCRVHELVPAPLSPVSPDSASAPHDTLRYPLRYPPRAPRDAGSRHGCAERSSTSRRWARAARAAMRWARRVSSRRRTARARARSCASARARTTSTWRGLT